MLSEAVLSPTAPVIGRSIRANNFRARYNAAVVAVHRGGARLQGKVGDIVLRSGDTLLLQADPHFGRAQRDNPDFYLVSSVEESRPVRHDKAFISLALLGVLLVLMATRVVPIVLAAFLVAGAMIGFRCVFTSDARRTIDYRTLVTIGAAFGFGGALDASGLVDAAASEIVGTAGRWGPVAVLASVFLLTSIFTEIVTNNAAAALMFPFAVAIAQQLGVNPRPFVIAVAFAASASFITPLGYQTNLMVFGPGGYKFTDYVRVGLPLNLLVLVVGTLLIPRVWPF
jgi:di/tricarboxylate transporter